MKKWISVALVLLCGVCAYVPLSREVRAIALHGPGMHPDEYLDKAALFAIGTALLACALLRLTLAAIKSPGYSRRRDRGKDCV